MIIFVPFASDYLTDHQPHGEGLICFSLLNGLAERGHKIFAFSPKVDIKKKSDNLYVYTTGIRMPLDSLNYFFHSCYSNILFKSLLKKHKFDLVWRMNPFGSHCPIPPLTQGLPLALGPFYYEWPNRQATKSKRSPISLGDLLRPFSLLGFKNTVAKTDILFSATEGQARELSKKFIIEKSYSLPLIIEPPSLCPQKSFEALKPIFVGNFLENKRPLLFCEVVKELQKRGYSCEGQMCGDGPEFEKVKGYILENKLNITLHGRVSNSEVMKRLDESNILINTSFGEPYGRNNVEAMSKGLVVFCHNSGGPKDFISSERNGVLVEDFSSSAFVDALVANRDNFEEMSKNAYESSLNWSADKVLSHLEHHLKAVIS